jgi:hypothetical protein
VKDTDMWGLFQWQIYLFPSKCHCVDLYLLCCQNGSVVDLRSTSGAAPWRIIDLDSVFERWSCPEQAQYSKLLEML